MAKAKPTRSPVRSNVKNAATAPLTPPLPMPEANGNGNGHANGHGPTNRVTNALDGLSPIQFQEVFNNRILWQRKILGMFSDRHRNIDDECGYPETEGIAIETYKRIYDRDPIAARVVNVYPQECWKVTPRLYESDDIDEDTPFEAAWDMLGSNLSGPGFYDDPETNPIWSYLERVDCLSGIGRHGVLLLGVDDGKPLSEPLELKEYKSTLEVEKVEEEDEFGNPTGKVTNIAVAKPVTKDGKPPSEEEQTKTTRKLLFLRAFDETMAQVATLDMDENSPRFGLPLTYLIQLITPPLLPTSVAGQSNVTTVKTTTVHWTRVVHIADNLQSDMVFGIPRLQVPYNRIYDLHKLYGGSAEMYWQGAFFGLSFETAPELAGAAVDVEGMRDQVESYREGLQRHLVPVPGMSVKSIAPQVVDPTPQIERHIEAICIHLACPKRVFMGSEIGVLAGDQDTRRWDGRCTKRCLTHITHNIILQLVDRLIQVGVLPVPPEGYRVEWPDRASMNDLEKAQIATQRTQAMSTYVSGGVDGLMDAQDYLVRELGFSIEEAEEIIKARMTTEMPQDPLPGQQFDEWGEPVPMEEQFGGKYGPQERQPPGKVSNAFCPTGEGGGVDPTCSPGTTGGSGRGAKLRQEIQERAAQVEFDLDYEMHEEELDTDDMDMDDLRDLIQAHDDLVDISELDDEAEQKYEEELTEEVDEEMEDWEPSVTREQAAKALAEEEGVEVDELEEDAIDEHHDKLTEVEKREAHTDARNDAYNEDRLFDIRMEVYKEWVEDNKDELSNIDGPEHTWVSSADDDASLYKFKISNGEEYLIKANYRDSRDLGGKKINIEFENVQEGMGVTGTGGATEVFGTVVPAVLALMQKEKPVVVMFSAASTPKIKGGAIQPGRTNSRQRLYDKLVRTVAGMNDEYFAVAFGGNNPNDPYGHRQYLVGLKSEELLIKKWSAVNDSDPDMQRLVNAERRWVKLRPEVNPLWFTPEGWTVPFKQSRTQFSKDRRRRRADNVFCPTGKGGGIDPTCSPDHGGGSGGDDSYQQTMEGEYWLMDGSSLYADGDIGDMNHEGYAIQQAQREVIDALGSEYSEFNLDEVDWEGFVARLEEEGDGNAYTIAKEAGVDRELWLVASQDGLTQRLPNDPITDPRSFATERWGWSRMAGNSIQLHSLDSGKLRDLASGISDAYSSVDEEEYNTQSYDIETKTAYYTDVPISVIESGDMSALRQYKNHGTPGWGGTSNQHRPSTALTVHPVPEGIIVNGDPVQPTDTVQGQQLIVQLPAINIQMPNTHVHVAPSVVPAPNVNVAPNILVNVPKPDPVVNVNTEYDLVPIRDGQGLITRVNRVPKE